MAGYDRIVARNFGGPEVLELEHLDILPEPGEGEVRVRVEAAGVGYTDTILRRGRYVGYTEGLPLTPGYDVVGVVEKLGPNVSGLRLGDRVADMPVHGAYSQFIIRSAADLIPVAAGVEAAAAVDVPLMWMTAWQMLTRSVSLPRGATILVVGANGAVGRSLVMLGHHLGLDVIGSCSAASMAFVSDLGALAVDYRRTDLLEAIRLASGGNRIAAAFDAIGDESWETSWRALGQGGVLVGYGFQDFLESGAPASIAGAALQRFRVTMNDEGKSDGTDRSATFYDIRERRMALPDEYRQDAVHLLGLIADGAVVPPPAEILTLDQASEAHRRIAKGGLRRRIVLRP